MTKAALYSNTGNEIAVEAIETEQLIPQPGFAERDMDVMRDAIYTTIRKTLRKAEIDAADIVGIACCGHGKGLYLWGKDGRPVRNAILSSDNRAYAYMLRWKADGTEEKAYRMSLQQVMACQPVALLNWLRDNEPEALNRTKWIFACKDFARFCLTGEARAELTDYSGDNLVNLRTKQYDMELLACYGISDLFEKLPPLCRATEICGTVDREAAEATGLLPGTPVAGGMFDIDACLLAVDAAREDRLCAIAGTWSINEYICREPVVDGSVRMNSVFCDPAYYLVEESSATSAGNNEWFIRTMLPELRTACRERGSSVYELCNGMVESVPASEFVPIFLPFLYASNVHPNAKSCFIGMTGYHTRAHMIRSVYEGIVYCHKYHIDALLRSRRKPFEQIRLAGGVARSPVWSQMFADIMQIPVETVDVNETGTLGCAIAAAVAAGEYSDIYEASRRMVHVGARFLPNGANAEAYQSRYRMYCRAIEALDPLWNEMQTLI